MTLNKDVVIRQDKDYTLYMDFYFDENNKNEAKPCVMWIHGGAWCVKELTRTYIPKEIEKWVDAGFVVASCEYRLSHEAHWPAQIEDCRYSFNYLKENATNLQINPDNIFVWGESAGGHLTTFLANDGVAAGACIWYPPVYFKELPAGCVEDEWVSLLIGTPDYNSEEKRRMISPLFGVNKGTCPCLVMHGTTDTLVDISQSEMLVEVMEKNDIDVTFVRVPDQGHGFFKGEEYYDTILKWMKERIVER